MRKYRLFSCIASAFLIASLIVPSGARASTITTVDTGGEAYQSLAMGRDGFARMVYYDWGGNQLKYAQCTNDDCSTKNITIIGPRGSNNSIAVGPDNLARIVYFGNDLQYVTCANVDCSSKTSTTLAPMVGNNFNAVSVVVGSDNLARVFYKENTFIPSVKYIRCLNNTCTSNVVSTIDSSDGSVNNISLAICGDGLPCMTYGQSAAVRFAHCTNDNCSAANTTTLSGVDPSGTDIAVGNDGFPRIIWTNDSGLNINYVLCANATCAGATTTPISSGFPLSSGSIAVGNDGLSRISYYNSSSGFLMYDACNNDACTAPTTVSIENTGVAAGQLTSVGIGADGFARLAYSYGNVSSGSVKLWVENVNTDATPECDTNAVVYCGVRNKTELLSFINNGDGVHSAANLQQIFYTELGYTPTGINNMVDGQMYPNGDIYVGATLVATGGRPSGREQQHPTDTQVGSLWRRADANFRAGVTEIDVLVNMDGAGSTFQYAVMKPCGNPVVGEPVGSVDESPGPSPSGSVAPPPTHNCCQLTNRSVTLGSSVVSASTTADFSWKRTGTAQTLRAVKIQVCTTTSYTSACIKPTGANMTAATLASTGGELGASGWSLTALDDHTVLITKAAGSATTVGVAETVGIAGFVNPSVYGSFSFRISTYNTTDADNDDVVDCGTVTTSTAKSITTSVDVAEMLVFRVANEVASNCTSETDIADPNDSTEDLVTLSPDPMSLTTAATSTAQFCIVTNAGGGYVITYRDEALGGPTKGFWNGAHEFPVVTNFTSTPGTEQFGFNLRANTVPVFGADPDAAGLVADLTNPQYSTVNQYSYNDTGTAIVLASKAAPSASARYTLAYLANISSLTPAGTYTAHQVFVATAAF